MKIYNVKIKTMADDRVIENGWVQIENGKFAAVCEGRPPGNGKPRYRRQRRSAFTGLYRRSYSSGYY